MARPAHAGAATAPASSDEAVCASAAGGDDLGWSLHVLTRGYAERARAAVSEVPNGLRGYLLLTRIAHESAASQLSLALQLGLDRTVMTYLLDELQSAGLVERRPDPHDRRARQVFITPAGSAVLRRTQEQLGNAEAETLAGLDAAERETLRALVHRVAGSLTAAGETCASQAATDCD